MFKKLTLLGMAVAAVAALVAPAPAGATQLKESGAAVKVGNFISLTRDPSNPIIIETSTLGEIKCSTFHIPALLARNAEEVMEIEQFGATTGSCNVNGASGASLWGGTGVFFSWSSEIGEANFGFEIEIPNLPEPCVFSTIFPEFFQFATGSNTIEFPEFAPAELETEPAYCGEAILYGGLIVETPGGTALEIS